MGLARRPGAVPGRPSQGNLITRAGWSLLRFTWHDLDGRPAGCLAEILETLALAA